MSDFVSGFWSWFIIVPVIIGIVAMFVLNRWMAEPKRKAGGKVQPTGHVWDENLMELNNPLPGWWLKLFYATLVFAIVYLALYPGLGTFPGLFGWTSHKQYDEQMQEASAKYGPLYDRYLKQDIVALAADPQAVQTGQRLFMTYCTGCHGSDAGGGPGFPNLRDNDWLYGGSPERIEETITQGRQANMPAWGPVLGEQGVRNVVQYVLSLSGRRVDEAAAAAGRQTFTTICAACHGPDGKGNPMIGAPNLTDRIWLYGGSERTVIQTVTDGRHGQMPAWGQRLGPARVHLLAAYVYSLSHETPAAGPQTERQ